MNYLEKLYKLRIDAYIKEYHRFPMSSQLIDLGISQNYMRRKYKNLHGFYKALGYGEVIIRMKEHPVILIDSKTLEYSHTLMNTELIGDYRMNYLKPYQQKYYLFSETAYEVFKRCESKKEYKDVMYFKYGYNLYCHARGKRKYANRKRRLANIKATTPLEQLIDVEKFKDIETL